MIAKWVRETNEGGTAASKNYKMSQYSRYYWKLSLAYQFQAKAMKDMNLMYESYRLGMAGLKETNLHYSVKA